MARLLLDENLPRSLVGALSTHGHDERSIAVDSPGVSDVEVLQQARDDSRWLVTFDADYGALVFLRGATPPECIVHLRQNPADTQIALDLTIRAPGAARPGQYVVVSKDGLRIRALPAPDATKDRS